MEGHDTLALLPTGGGKSVCFQVPAMALEGVCLVISPLMALMYDQVQNLNKRGITAHAITSAMKLREIDRILDNCVYGEVKFLYVSPERLKNEMFIERFKKMKISMIAVDESHCISQWGYDFRPDYLKIAEIREFKPAAPVLALTASATPAVVSDIQHKLAFKKELVIGTSFSRENLSYNVSEQEDKEGKLLEICRKMPGCGIVYCGTRLRTKEVTELLVRNKISATTYNAGMSTADRDLSFRRWMKNEARIMCATNAFGMGIDKPDVRLVIHSDVPQTPEAYFQEAGRAGRDGQKAYAVLLYNKADILKLQKQLEQKFPSREFVRKVYAAICNELQLAPGSGKDIAYSFQVTPFCKKFELNYSQTLYAIKLLALAGYLTLDEAAFLPSRIYFSINRQDLYSFQVANASMDAFIKVLLRMYGGLFEQYVSIREDDIARNAKLTLQQTREKLVLLKKNGILDYEPQNDDPKLTLLTGRMHEGSITLTPEVYEQRKKSETERLHAMERYLEKRRCRSIQLLEYFGEKDVAACGTCDVCRENNKHGLRPQEYELMNKAVMDIALTRAITIEDLPKVLPQFSREHLIEYTRWKLDTGELILDDSLCISIPGMENE